MASGFTPPTSSGETALTLDLSSSSMEQRDRERSPARVTATVARASSAGARMMDDNMSMSSYSPHTRRRSRALHNGATRGRGDALHMGAPSSGVLTPSMPPLPTYTHSASHVDMHMQEDEANNTVIQQNVLQQQQNNLLIGLDPVAVAGMAAEAASAIQGAQSQALQAQAEAASAIHGAQTQALQAQADADLMRREAASAVHAAQAQANEVACQAAAAVSDARAQQAGAQHQAEAFATSVLQRVNQLEAQCRRLEEEKLRLQLQAGGARVAPGSAIPSLNGDGSEIAPSTAPSPKPMVSGEPSGHDSAAPGMTPHFTCAECGRAITHYSHHHQCQCGRLVHFSCLCTHGSSNQHLTSQRTPPPPPPAPHPETAARARASRRRNAALPIAGAPPPPPPPEPDDEGDDDEDDEDEDEDSEEEDTDDDVVVDPDAPPPPPLCSYCGGTHADGACLSGLQKKHSDATSTTSTSRDSVTGSKRKEKNIIDQKAMIALKLDPFATDAAQHRGWLNRQSANIGKIDNSKDDYLRHWWSQGTDLRGKAAEKLRTDPGHCPRFDRYIAAEAAARMSSAGDAMLDMQAYIESCNLAGLPLSGRYLVNIVCRQFDVDRQRGAVLTKVSLYAIQLEDYSIDGLRDFKNRVQYALSSIRESEHPDQFESGEWLLQKLKLCRRLEQHIEAVKESKMRSKKRRFDWLWGKLKKVLADSREDGNAAAVSDSLTQGTKARAKKKAKPGAPGQQQQQQQQQPQDGADAAAGAAGAKGKGKGKGKGKEKGKEDTPPAVPKKAGPEPPPKRDPKTIACMFEVKEKGSCQQGAKCSFAHDEAIVSAAKSKAANKAKAPKGKNKSTPGGVGLAVQAVVGGSLITPTKEASPDDPPELHIGAPGGEGSFLARAVSLAKSGLSAIVKELRLQQLATVAVAGAAFAVPARPDGPVSAAVMPATAAQSQTFTIRRIADSGAGEDLASEKAMLAQGIPKHIIDQYVKKSAYPCNFDTGGGVQPADETINVSAAGYDSTTYMLKRCPWVFAQAKRTELQCMPYIHLPGQLPFFVTDQSKLKVEVDEAAKWTAVELHHYTPEFEEEVTLSPGCVSSVPAKKGKQLSLSASAEAAAPTEAEVPPVPAAHPEPRPASGRKPLPKDHNDDHWPRRPDLCRVCGEAVKHFAPKRRFCNQAQDKQQKQLDQREANAEFLGRVHIDHKVVAGADVGLKGETSSLIVHDEYTGATLSYPDVRADLHSVDTKLRHFGGRKAATFIARVHSDNAPVLIEAAEQLGWLSETSPPNQTTKNTTAEKAVQDSTDGGKRNLLQSGFPHGAWPMAEAHYNMVSTFKRPAACDESMTRFKAVTGYDFSGYIVPFGALVRYKPNPKDQSAYEPDTRPGLFIGYDLQAGFIWKEVYKILDYAALRQGRWKTETVREISVPDKGTEVFPVANAMKKALETFKDIDFSSLELPDADSLGSQASSGSQGSGGSHGVPKKTEEKPKASSSGESASASSTAPAPGGGVEVPKLTTPEAGELHTGAPSDGAELHQGAPDPGAKSPSGGPPTELPGVAQKASTRHVSITQARIDKHGRTPGCKACDPLTLSTYHTKACRERFDSLYPRDPGPSSSGPSASGPSASVPTDSKGAEVSAATAGLLRLLKGESGEVKKVDGNHNFKYNVGATLRACPSPQGGDAVQKIIGDILSETEEFFQETEREAARAVLTDRYISACAAYKVPRGHAQGSKVDSKTPFIEFCCAPDSELCKTAEDYGVPFLRLSKEDANLEDPSIVLQVFDFIKRHPKCHLYGSLPCTAWTSWQNMSIHKLGEKYLKRLMRRRQKSLQLFKTFEQVAEAVHASGGTISFEWPRHCYGWTQPAVMSFIQKFDLYEATFDGCAFGMRGYSGESVLKPWRVVTSSSLLAYNLNHYKCGHPKDFVHDHVQGGLTSKTAFYPRAMCETIIGSLYPYTVTNHIPAMICNPVVQQEHRHKDSNFSVFDAEKPTSGDLWNDVAFVIETDPEAARFGAPGSGDILVPALVTQLLSRKEMLSDPEALKAVRKEADGLEQAGTWDNSTVTELSEVVRKAKETGESVHLGHLMSICSIKFAELAKELQVYKGRIVYRGDNARDEYGTAAVYQELAASPTSIQAANANISYGMISGNKTTCADAIKAYVQALLKSEHKTWIQLPPELWPAEWKGRYSKPVVLLVKSLYGHPEAGGHWQNHFEDAVLNKLPEEWRAKRVDAHPSSYWIPSKRLLLTVYVDDLVLSGPEGNHAGFWAEISKHIDLEEVTGLERFLGRHHVFSKDADGNPAVAFDMQAYAQQTVDLYLASTAAVQHLVAPAAEGDTEQGKKAVKLKAASTPFCPDGSLLAVDDEEKGELSSAACSILMKALWLARLARPDILKAIGDLASHVQKWSRNDDKKLYRLICYINSTKHFLLKGKVGDPLEQLKLRLYVDADFCGDKLDTKSTNGGYLVLYGPNTFFPLVWVSRKQTATSRSTTESEIVSLAHSLFLEALPMLTMFDTIKGSAFDLEICEDNQATIIVAKAGFSQKLRHIQRTHKVNIGSIKEVIEQPYCSLEYIDTKLQAADIFTKALEPSKWQNALHLLSIDDSEPRAAPGCAGRVVSRAAPRCAGCGQCPRNHHSDSTHLSKRGERNYIECFTRFLELYRLPSCVQSCRHLNAFPETKGCTFPCSFCTGCRPDRSCGTDDSVAWLMHLPDSHEIMLDAVFGSSGA